MSKAKENSQIASKLLSDVGSIVTADSDSLELLSPGTDGQVLTADSTVPNGIKWATAGASGLSAGQITDLTDSGESTLHYHASDRDLANATGTLAVANGGTASTTAQTAINLLTNVAATAAGNVLTKVGSDAAWATPSGAGIGDVSGPASAVSSNVAAFDGTTGKLIKDGGVLTTNIATKTGTETLTNKTMSTGSTWTGNAVGALYGGTAQTSYTKGDILYSSATNTLAKLPVGAVGQVLAVSSSGIPAWQGSGGAITNYHTFTGVADFVLGPGSTKVSGTDNSAAMDAALATNLEIYVPAGNYWISNLTTRNNMSFAHITGPGVLWGYTNVGYTKLGRTLSVGTNRSHEAGSVGGLTVGGEDDSYGMRLWAGHHNWMQFQSTRYGAPSQIQIYPSVWSCTAYPVSPDRLNAVYGTFDTTELFVGDYIGWNGGLYVTTYVSASYITVTKAFVGGSPGWATNAALEKPVFKAYETSTGTCNTSGTTVTYVTGEQFPYGYSGDHMYAFINGVKYTVTTGPESAGANTLILSTSAGTQTGVSIKFYRQYAPWSYVSLLRLQGIAGGKESVGVFSLNTRNEILIGAAATHYTLAGNMRVEAPRIRIGGGEQYPYNGTTDSYGIEVIEPMDNLSFGAHYVSLGGYNGREALRTITWNAYTDHLTVYGSVSGVNPGPNIAAEGTSANLDISLTPKGTGAVRVGVTTTDDTSNWFATGVDGYWSNNGTHLKIGAASNSVNPPVWVQNTTTYNNAVTSHYASCALFETIKTSGAGVPNSLTGSVRITGGTGDAIGVHGQVVADIATTGISTGVWARATGPTSAITAGAICGLEINVDNRYGAIAAKARKDGGSYVGLLIYNFSGTGKANHFGFVVEGTATDAYHVGGLIEDFQGTGLNILGTRSANYGLHINSESVDQLGRGIYLGTRCATAGIGLGDNKINFGDYTGATWNNGDMWVNGGNLYIKLGGVNRQVALV